jgi:hypothetical protein
MRRIVGNIANLRKQLLDKLVSLILLKLLIIKRLVSYRGTYGGLG